MILSFKMYLLANFLLFAHPIPSNPIREKRFWLYFETEKLKQEKQAEENKIRLVNILLESFQDFILKNLTQQKQQPSTQIEGEKLDFLYRVWLHKEIQMMKMKDFWLLRQG